MSKPKKIKKSKFNVTGQDLISESLYGKGAIQLNNCRIIMRDGGSIYAGEQDEPNDEEKWVKRMGMYGVAINVPNMVNGDGKLQMWDCDLIIIPRKKYRDGFNGKRADQILCSGGLGNPECWKEEIFDIDDKE